MSEAAYSTLKALRYPDRLQAIREGKRVAPVHVHFILSDLCNHDCHFCAYRMSGGLTTQHFPDEEGRANPQRWIPAEKASELIDDFSRVGVEAVQFTGGGEPTVHPQHLALFKQAQDAGLKTALVTNGDILRERDGLSWETVYPRMSWIRVSIDAGDAETYARVRDVSPARYERVLKNLERIVEACRHTDTLVGAGYVVTPENYERLLEGIARIKATGVKYVRLAAMFSDSGTAPYQVKTATGKRLYDQIIDRIGIAKELLQDDGFRIVDLFGRRIEDLEQESPDYTTCSYQRFTVYVAGNLKVYRCCSTSYTDLGLIGDLSDRGFFDWWWNEAEGKHRDFDARACQFCQFNAQNRAINYAVAGDVIHGEFI